jgi:hypothetical protein
MTIPELLESLRGDAFAVDSRWDYGYGGETVQYHVVALDNPKYAEELILEFLKNPEVGP